MELLARLHSHCRELTSVVESLSPQSLGSVAIRDRDPSYCSPLHSEHDQQARQTILNTINKIRILVCGTSEFLQHLANQNEVLAGLIWLGELQVLACIPLNASVPIKDTAELSCVPEAQLTRVIRLMATVGFLHEPRRDHVAHTHLSASFILSPSLYDAAMFLSTPLAPVSMPKIQSAEGCKESVTAQRAAPFDLPTVNYGAKVNRGFTAYLQHVGRAGQDMAPPTILKQLDWRSIINFPDPGCIVEVNGPSPANSLAKCLVEKFPPLRGVVQTHDQDIRQTWPNCENENGADSHVAITNRMIGSPQPVLDAALYILHLPISSPNLVFSELMMHFTVMQASRASMLICTSHLLPEPGSLPNSDCETLLRSVDLARCRLTNEGHLEMVDLLRLMDSVGDGTGKLVVTQTIRFQNNVVAALLVQYQSHWIQV